MTPSQHRRRKATRHALLATIHRPERINPQLKLLPVSDFAPWWRQAPDTRRRPRQR